jgi:signal transduction histidine kinase
MQRNPLLVLTAAVLWQIILFASLCAQPNTQLMQKADSLYQLGMYSDAANVYNDIFQQEKENSRQTGIVAFRLGRCYEFTGRLDEAESFYGKSAAIFSELEIWENHFVAQSKLANIADKKGNYSKAIAISEKAVSHFEAQNDSLRMAGNLNDLALYHYHAGDIQKSIDIYTKAIEIVSDKDDPLKAIVYNQLGNIWAVDLKNEEKALEYYHISLQLKQKSASLKSLSAAYNNIGISHKNLGNADSAMYYYNQALYHAEISNDPSAACNPLINIANLYKNQNNFDEALKTYNKVSELKEYMSVQQQITLHTSLGILYNRKEAYKMALGQILIAESLLQETNNLIDLADLLSQKAFAYNGLRDFQKAYQMQLQHTKINDSIQNRERAQQLADLMLKFEAAEKDKSILEQQQIIKQKQLDIQKRNNWLILTAGVILLVSGLMFSLFKRKEALVREANLELKLAEQKELTRLQNERLRISRELHDNIGSYLTLISASLEQLSDTEQNLFQEKVPALRNVISTGMRELRRTVWMLNKSAVSVDELALQLRDFFKPLNHSGIKISVQVFGNTDQTISDIQSTHLFRIIQESVNNACKYAACSKINVKIETDENKRLHFSITDDGKGFDESTAGEGFGLTNLKSRINELKGDLKITSSPEKGTAINGFFDI